MRQSAYMFSTIAKTARATRAAKAVRPPRKVAISPVSKQALVKSSVPAVIKPPTKPTPDTDFTSREIAACAGVVTWSGLLYTKNMCKRYDRSSDMAMAFIIGGIMAPIYLPYKFIDTVFATGKFVLGYDN